jgi:hypothetical protein
MRNSFKVGKKSGKVRIVRKPVTMVQAWRIPLGVELTDEEIRLLCLGGYEPPWRLIHGQSKKFDDGTKKGRKRENSRHSQLGRDRFDAILLKIGQKVCKRHRLEREHRKLATGTGEQNIREWISTPNESNNFDPPDPSKLQGADATRDISALAMTIEDQTKQLGAMMWEELLSILSGGDEKKGGRRAKRLLGELESFFREEYGAEVWLKLVIELKSRTNEKGPGTPTDARPPKS